MLFIDFEHLKIIKDFHFTTFEDETEIAKDAAVLEAQKAIRALCGRIVRKDGLNVNYIINIKTEEPNEDFFLTMVNIVNAEFFRAMTTEEGWKREYRLDVPEKLKGLHANMSLIKKACNLKTVNSVFNLTIKCGDFIYYLCDEKNFKDNPEFVHDVEELETKDE